MIYMHCTYTALQYYFQHGSDLSDFLQDDISESSPQLSDRLHSPSEPSNSSFVSSPCVSPVSSPAPSPSENVFLGNISNQVGPIALCTPSASTVPPVPLPSYQYPPYPPPDSACTSPPETMVSLSPHLSSPLLNVALPSLIPSHAPRPPDSADDDSSRYPRNAARALNRLQLNKGKQFNVKHTAFPPKPLRVSDVFILLSTLHMFPCSAYFSNISDFVSDLPFSGTQEFRHVLCSARAGINACRIQIICGQRQQNFASGSCC